MATRAEAKEWGKAHIKGLWGVHWTPFDSDFEIDEPGLRTHIQRVLQLDLDGISVGTAVSELWHLSLAERKLVARVALEEIDHSIPATYSATTHSIADTLDLVHHAEDLGYEAVLLWPPYEHAKSEREMYTFYEHVASKTNIAIVAFRTPHSGRLMTPELVGAIADIEAVCAVKYVSWSFTDYARVADIAQDRIVVSIPMEELWLPSMLHCGGQALCSTSAAVLYQTPAKQPIKRYTDLAMAGDGRGATEAYHDLKPIRDLWKELYTVYPRENRHPVAETKYWAKALGYLDDARIRPPQTGAAPEAFELIDRVLAEQGYIEGGSAAPARPSWMKEG